LDKASEHPRKNEPMAAVPSSSASSVDLDLERLAGWLGPLASPVRLRLLRFLTQPHYLEEVASHLKLTRQAARKHLDQLVAIGVLEKRSGTRETGPVTEYIINPQALFLIYDEFEKLGTLRRDEPREVLHRTMAEPGRRVAAQPAEGSCFWIVRGLNTGHRAMLQRRTDRRWVIGRDEECDLAVAHDPYASNRHAEVRWDGQRYLLADLRSTNGTHHNWTLLPRGGEVALRHGDLVGVGKTLLLFWGMD
jgi:DNA-binding transcriptional ArsR family regulator